MATFRFCFAARKARRESKGNVMISEQVTTKIEKLAKATKPQAKGTKPKAKAAPVAAKAKKVAPAPVVEPVVAEPAAPAPAASAPTAPLALKDQVFADFGLRTATHRAALVNLLVDRINTQVPIATLAGEAWKDVSQKTSLETSVSTSVKKLERRIVRNKLEAKYRIVREVAGQERTVGLYVI